MEQFDSSEKESSKVLEQQQRNDEQQCPSCAAELTETSVWTIAANETDCMGWSDQQGSLAVEKKSPDNKVWRVWNWSAAGLAPRICWWYTDESSDSKERMSSDCRVTRWRVAIIYVTDRFIGWHGLTGSPVQSPCTLTLVNAAAAALHRSAADQTRLYWGWTNAPAGGPPTSRHWLSTRGLDGRPDQCWPLSMTRHANDRIINGDDDSRQTHKTRR